MSTHFSANQYEQAFAAQRLQNWEIPKIFKERPSTLEGFTRPISNDRGHILPGIPRSSKSPWGEFVGTWDMKKAPLRTKTMKTVTSKSEQNEEPDKNHAPSPKQEVAPDKVASPTHAQEPVPEKLRTPSPGGGVVPEKVQSPTALAKARSPSLKEGEIPVPTSPRPASQQSQSKKTPSPARLKTPDIPPSPVKTPLDDGSCTDKKKVTLIA